MRQVIRIVRAIFQFVETAEDFVAGLLLVTLNAPEAIIGFQSGEVGTER